MDCSLPGSSIHGIFQATVLEWAAIAFSRNLGHKYINLSKLREIVKDRGPSHAKVHGVTKSGT